MLLLNSYRPRQMHTYPMKTWGGCRTKLYEIIYPENTPGTDAEWKIAGDLFAIKRMEFPDKRNEAGYGYLILHKGMDSNYIVCNWWAGENMLRMFSFRASPDRPLDYGEIDNGLNICVWDMLIHNHERNSFVKYILSRADEFRVKDYLSDLYIGEK